MVKALAHNALAPEKAASTVSQRRGEQHVTVTVASVGI